MPPSNDRPPSVLLAEDDDDFGDSIMMVLESEGYEVRVVPSGDALLIAVREILPDIILTDINMPGRNGLEVCRLLKNDPDTREIPVIFISALSKTQEKIMGLRLGGVDYLTKPFEIEELLARLENHLELKRLRDALAEKVQDLEEKNDRLSLFSKALAHDLRGPLGMVMGMSDPLMIPDTVSGEARENLDAIHASSKQMKGMIDSLLLLATTDCASSECDQVSMDATLEIALGGLAGMIQESGGRVEVTSPLPPAIGNHGWIKRVWSNFLSNAIKYGGQPPVVTVGVEELPGEMMNRYWVEDNGSGLNAEQQAKLFTPFQRLQPDKAEGIGLGLVIVQKIVTQMGGQVGVRNGERGGSRFFFTLPREPVDPRHGCGLRDRTFSDLEESVALSG